jgi:hypothetical protein
MKAYVRAAVAAVSFVAGASTSIAAEPVGNASAIIPAASQQEPQGTRSDLRLRDPIIRNAELATAERGALEVTFLDGSKLSMGQNSRLTVDEYVYAGPGGASRQTIRYTKGLFRFVSGSIPKDNVKVETPTVTIGIRGTAFRSLIEDSGDEAFSVEEGPNGETYEVTITDKKTGEKVVVRSGQMVTHGVSGFGNLSGGELQGCQ